jgi:hypothetical protein
MSKREVQIQLKKSIDGMNLVKRRTKRKDRQLAVLKKG